MLLCSPVLAALSAGNNFVSAVSSHVLVLDRFKQPLCNSSTALGATGYRPSHVHISYSFSMHQLPTCLRRLVAMSSSLESAAARASRSSFSARRRRVLTCWRQHPKQNIKKHQKQNPKNHTECANERRSSDMRRLMHTLLTALMTRAGPCT